MRNAMADETIRNAIAGGTAGLVSAIVTCPLDMVKLQIQNGKNGQRSALQTFEYIWKHHGIRGLYRGVYATSAGYLPTWAIYFTVYDASKNGLLIHCLSAIQAGLICTTVTNPLWVVRTRIMTQSLNPQEQVPNHLRSVFRALVHIPKTEGWTALFKGLGPSLIGVSHVAVQFPLYEKFKMLLSNKPGFDGYSIIVASGLSKVIASGITYPHEVVRTRLQTQLNTDPMYKRKYTGIFQTIDVVYKEEGFRGFYRGYLIGLGRTVPASALTIWTFEFLSNVFETYAN